MLTGQRGTYSYLIKEDIFILNVVEFENDIHLTKCYFFDYNFENIFRFILLNSYLIKWDEKNISSTTRCFNATFLTITLDIYLRFIVLDSCLTKWDERNIWFNATSLTTTLEIYFYFILLDSYLTKRDEREINNTMRWFHTFNWIHHFQ